MRKVQVCVVRTAGTNCDKETVFAFTRAGAEAHLVHINQLLQQRRRLDEFQIIALPGGFSYGDDIAAGRIQANELRFKLGGQLAAFIAAGKLIIGICNGFQILVKAGLLPGNPAQEQDASLIINDSGQFQDQWVWLRGAAQAKKSRCVWAQGLPEKIYLPIAHGEGKFVVRDQALMQRIKRNHQIVFQYCGSEGRVGAADNPNGSSESIAGICDESGRILGLMPHPERHMLATQHPRWTGQQASVVPGASGDGQHIFNNGVEYAQKHLL